MISEIKHFALFYFFYFSRKWFWLYAPLHVGSRCRSFLDILKRCTLGACVCVCVCTGTGVTAPNIWPPHFKHSERREGRGQAAAPQSLDGGGTVGGDLGRGQGGCEWDRHHPRQRYTCSLRALFSPCKARTSAAPRTGSASRRTLKISGNEVMKADCVTQFCEIWELSVR